MAIPRSSAARSRASSSGRRAATAALATIRSSRRMAVRRRLARSNPPKSTRSATAPAPLPSSSKAASGAAEVSAAEPLAVYIHWPFCVSKCPYCDFNSYLRDKVDSARWTRALLADLDHYAESVPGRAVGSVFFGGGTPSLMPPETVAALLDRVRSHWDVMPDLEVTLEANPNSAEAARFQAFAAAGVNRLSLGVQALDPAALRMLGRAHDRSEAIAAIEHARASFPRFSFDLIYARPCQGVAAWRRELDEGLLLAEDHLSLYQLTIEPGTAFATLYKRAELVVPAEDNAAALFETTQDRLAAHGLPAYEISNHARPGAECRHNLAYWRYQDYIGVGPGAHGRLTQGGVKHATRQRRLPERWLAAVEEMLMMGLRLTEGVPRAQIERAAGQDAEALFGRNVAPLVEGGFLTLDRDRLAATAAGRLRLNAVLAALLC